MKIQVRKLSEICEKSIGLIGKKTVYPVYFTTRFGIHTFGMLKAIDVLVLDSQDRVVRLKENIYPNRLFFWPPVYSRIIELPAGWIRLNKVVIGTTINISPQ